MQLLEAHARHYSWGSRTLIPQLLGQERSDKPVAELWFGAHPAAPSTIAGRGLDEIIAEDPQRTLGPRVREEFGDRLPFLMKILAADAPLSIQAHPTMAQAQEGFAKENALGIALDDSKRNYKDDSHKPELIVALTDFYAMAGFRPLEQTRELFEALQCSELDHYLGMIDGSEEAEESDLRALFTTWITIPAATRTALIDSVVACADQFLADADPRSWMAQDLRTVVSLNEQYPGDIGVLGALLLNHVHLSPGEALFLAAGQLHAYISGMGVEIMANSDNVLRGGLTPKYVDVPELVKILDFSALQEPRVAQENYSGRAEVTGAQAWNYPVPVDEFALTRGDFYGGDVVNLDYDGPGIILCTGGTTKLSSPASTDGDTELSLQPGQAAWLSANQGEVEISVDRASGASTAQVFVARV